MTRLARIAALVALASLGAVHQASAQITPIFEADLSVSGAPGYNFAAAFGIDISPGYYDVCYSRSAHAAAGPAGQDTVRISILDNHDACVTAGGGSGFGTGFFAPTGNGLAPSYGSVRYVRYAFRVVSATFSGSFGTKFSDINANDLSATNEQARIIDTVELRSSGNSSCGGALTYSGHYFDTTMNILGCDTAGGSTEMFTQWVKGIDPLVIGTWYCVQQMLSFDTSSGANNGFRRLYVNNDVVGSPTASTGTYDFEPGDWTTGGGIAIGGSDSGASVSGRAVVYELAAYELDDEFDPAWNAAQCGGAAAATNPGSRVKLRLRSLGR